MFQHSQGGNQSGNILHNKSLWNDLTLLLAPWFLWWLETKHSLCFGGILWFMWNGDLTFLAQQFAHHCFSTLSLLCLSASNSRTINLPVYFWSYSLSRTNDVKINSLKLVIESKGKLLLKWKGKFIEIIYFCWHKSKSWGLFSKWIW